MDKTALFNLSYGLYAIGVKDNERDCGCIVNTIFQITTVGPLVALSINKDNYTYDLIKRNRRFTVSILSTATKPEVITALGFLSGCDHDKWQGFNYDYLEGMPIVKENCLSHFVLDVESMYDVETHVVVIAKVSEAINDYQGEAMTYDYYHNVIKGMAPEKAPTYQAQNHQETLVKNSEGKWTCKVCGWVYDGDDFEAEPDTFRCPICNQPKTVFEKR